jgi:hypothetical protein
MAPDVCAKAGTAASTAVERAAQASERIIFMAGLSEAAADQSIRAKLQRFATTTVPRHSRGRLPSRVHASL